MASAQTGKPPVSISVPDLPNVGSLLPGDDDASEPEGSATPLGGITPGRSRRQRGGHRHRRRR
ncbi:hypothetical protein STENM36S_09346 [Streptomyces tendae]